MVCTDEGGVSAAAGPGLFDGIYVLMNEVVPCSGSWAVWTAASAFLQAWLLGANAVPLFCKRGYLGQILCPFASVSLNPVPCPSASVAP